MPHSSTIEVDDRELERALAALGRQAKRVARPALRAGARVILAEARRRVPVRTGRLKRSLRIRQRTRRGAVEMRVGSALPYAHLVELGTKAHEQPKRHRRHPGAEARPFLRPAMDVKGSEAVEVVKARIRAALTKVKG